MLVVIEESAAVIAPAATMIAAMMTAANLGARTTGWGFVVFTIGSIGWVTIAVATGQTNLLWSNAFLTLVNLVGIWRWLGRRARVEDAADAEAVESRRGGDAGRLFAATGLDGTAVIDRDGTRIATAVEAMADMRTGRIDHVIVRLAGKGGTLRRLPWAEVRMDEEGLATRLRAGDAQALAPVRG